MSSLIMVILSSFAYRKNYTVPISVLGIGLKRVKQSYSRRSAGSLALVHLNSLPEFCWNSSMNNKYFVFFILTSC